jgi:hypothetical protein
MESKVSRSGVVGVMVGKAAGLVAGVVFAVSANAGGGGGGGMCPGCATEITQLANHAELIAQVGQAVQTTANTLMTAQSTMQMLRQLPASVVDDVMSKLPVDKVKALADAYVVMSDAVRVYRDAEDVLRKAEQDAEMLRLTPSELLQRKATVAAVYGGAYQQAYNIEQNKLALLAKTAKEVQRQAEVVKTIDSNIGGIQFLASQNVQLQATLGAISESITKANMLAFEEAKKKQDSHNAYYASQAAADDELRRNQQRDRAMMDAFSSDGLIPRR